MTYNLEHPDISRALRTGYAKNYHDPRLCECCGENPIDEKFWELDGFELCDDCVINMAFTELKGDPKRAAELIGAIGRTA